MPTTNQKETTSMEWNYVEIRNYPTMNCLIDWLFEHIVTYKMGKCDTEYNINVGAYHSPWPAPTSNPEKYNIVKNEDLGFTVYINGRHWIVGLVEITDKYLSHRVVRYLVAQPQEQSWGLWYSEVSDWRW